VSPTVNHHPESHQPHDESMHTAEHASGSRAEANHYEGNTKLLPWLMLTCILSGFSVAVATMTFFYLHDQMLRDQRSFEQMRVQVLSQNAILLREGFIKPGDEWMGPESNLQFDPKLWRK
jgi:hypothetical protein